MADNPDKLFPEFPPVSTPDWEEKIREDLKGADFEKKLIWKTPEGIRIKPVYRSEDVPGLDYRHTLPGQYPFVRGTKAGDNRWHIRQPVLVENVAKANLKALVLIERGITSLEFVFTRKHILSQDEFESLLQHIPLHTTAINFSGYRCERSAGMLVNYAVKLQAAMDQLKGSVNFDPLGRLCRKGNFSYDSEALSSEMLVRLIEETKTIAGLRTTGINARIFGNAGASIVQELAFGLAMGAEYLSILTEKGLSAGEAAAKMVFHFAVSPHYFMEIAKYRAARLLWAGILKAFDTGCHEPMVIHAETSRWNLTTYDPYVNMLRTTTESMSAILAGIDALTVLPFDLTFENPSEFAERIARNQQIILKEESYFDRVIDPAAGSYFIESLTDSVAAESWKLFLAVQQHGGFIDAMKGGFIREQVINSARQRDLALATRRELCVGTNQYPDFAENYGTKPQDFATECCCDCKGETFSCEEDGCGPSANYYCDCREGHCDCSCCNENKRITEPLRQYRGTREFEKLRLKTDLGKRKPKVFMLTIGNLSMRLARSQFASNFFACAGYEVIDNNGFTSAEEGVRAAVEAGADIVVLCSSDEEYAALAPETFKQLNGRAILVVAGSPPCTEELKAQGVENFIHIRSNVLETLKEYHIKLGIEP